jgi:hypothetical protein
VRDLENGVWTLSNLHLKTKNCFVTSEVGASLNGQGMRPDRVVGRRHGDRSLTREEDGIHGVVSDSRSRAGKGKRGSISRALHRGDAPPKARVYLY